MKFKSDEPILISWGCFFLGIAIILWVLSLTGCKNQIPAIDVSFWAGNATQGGITRAQEGRSMSCLDPDFDKYVCITYDDIRKVFDTILMCKDWPKSQLASAKDVKRFIKKNSDIIKYVRANSTSREDSELESD